MTAQMPLGERPRETVPPALTARPLHIGINTLSILPVGGGIWTYCAELLRALPQVDPRVRYTLLTNPAVLATLDAESRARFAAIHVVGERGGPLASAQAYLANIPWITRASPLDLFFSPHIGIPLIWGGKLVVTIHDISRDDLSGEFERVSRTVVSQQSRHAARAARHLLTDSAFSRERIAAVYGVPRERITAVHLGAPSRFFAAPDRATLDGVRARYSVRGPYILAHVTSQPYKNAGLLIEAFADLRRSVGSDLQLVCYGAFHDGGSAIRERIRLHDLEDAVVFTGRVDDHDLPALYHAAALFAFPSRYEGFGIPVLEAMASGTPVVASTAASLPEVAGDTALLVHPNDRTALTLALRHGLWDDALRSRLIAGGIQRARAFTWQRTATETLTALRMVAGRSRG